jgi:hypothetical protein
MSLLIKLLFKFSRGKWTNTLCPVCGHWMRAFYDDRMPEFKGVRMWYCINPKHEGSRIV